jgi:hypothetical protein
LETKESLLVVHGIKMMGKSTMTTEPYRQETPDLMLGVRVESMSW